jgi:hypothetical protein
MKRLLRAGVCCSALAAIVAAGLVAPAPAATSGLVFDSVSRFGGNGADTAEPGTFEADFEQASKPREAKHLTGPFAGMMNAAMDKAGGPMALLQNGIAERHYYAGSFERTDDIAGRTATITDCAARTITTLNLAKKTYRVVSLDQPATYESPGGPAQPRATPTDDGTRVSAVVKTTSLGAKTIGPDPTNGYNLDVKITTTKRTGESQTNEMTTTSYYSNYPNQVLVCSSSGSTAAPGPAGNVASLASTMSRVLTASGKDSRFKVSSSGPAIPSGRLSLFDRIVPQVSGGGGGANGGFGMLTERGHVRGITDADPAFRVPPDFTKEK